MHLSNVASLFSVLSFVCASSLAVRSATDVERDIATIQSQVDKVDGDIKAFTGSLDQALALVSDFRTLEINVDAGTKDATDAGVFSPGDSDNIYKSLKSLTDHIGTALTDGLEKADLVKNAGYASQVHDGLQNLQGKTDNFFVAVEKDSDANSGKVADLQHQVDDEFTKAIASFS